MKAFWRLAAKGWAPALPSWEMLKVLCAGEVARLMTAGVLHTVAIQPGDRVPCPTCRWHARVIAEPTGCVIICESELPCEDVELGPAPYRLVANARELERRLAEALGLEGTPGTGDGIIPLGWRQFGDESVAFDLCPVVGRKGVEDALYRLARSGPRVRVVLVPDSRFIPGNALPEIAGAELVWLGLDEVVTLDRRLRADLRPLLHRRRFHGFTLDLPFDGLTLDEEGATWQAKPLPLKPRALRLLRSLVKHHPDTASRAQLWREVWPEDHTRTGEIARGVVPELLDSRLRQAVAELRNALGDEVVENARGSEHAGGYRLSLPPKQLRAA